MGFSSPTSIPSGLARLHPQTTELVLKFSPGRAQVPLSCALQLMRDKANCPTIMTSLLLPALQVARER